MTNIEGFSLYNLSSDIPRLCFEYAAESSRETALSLALVCPEVRSWVEPIIYRCLTLNTPTRGQNFVTMAESSTHRPLSFYRLYVKKICLHRVSRDAAAKILSYCHPNASLAYWSTPDYSDTTGNDLATLINSNTFQPSRLSTYISHLFKGATLNFRLPFFQNITHLDVTDSHFSSYWGVFEQAGFRELPRLTHLALEFRDHLGQLEIDLALATSPPTLKVCLLWMDGVERIENWGLEDVAIGRLDPRLVFYTPRDESGHDFNGNVLFVSYDEFFQQWGYTPQGVADFWEVAEEIVNKRLVKQGAQLGQSS